MKKTEQLAAAFAYGCRRTKELGIDDELREFVKTGDRRVKILGYLKQLEPYFCYQLIAQANGIKNIFDRRVIEGYWIGNRLLEKVTPEQINYVLARAELKSRIKYSFLLAGGKVHHNYIVFAAVPVKTIKILETLNNCLISWGKVKKIESSHLLVSTQPIILRHQQWSLGSWQNKIIDKGLIGKVKIGDWLAIHFGAARSVLSLRDYRQLRKYTQAAIVFFNKRSSTS